MSRGTVHTDDVAYISIVEFDGLGNPVYIGIAVPGSLTSDPVWQLRHLTGYPSPVITLYADGNASRHAVWDNRASLTYS